MLSALHRKLLRDLRAAGGQVIAISCVLAAGIATYVMAASTLDSLLRTQDRMYREFRFPELFAGLKRAPASLQARIQEIPGVQTVETRTVAPANIELENFPQPISGQVVGLPRGEGLLNLLHLHSGRYPEPNNDREALVSDGFAKAHNLRPGFSLSATINGRRQQLIIAGIASSPEFTYQLAPGSIVPDFKTYCVVWMNAAPLEASFQMTGAFNQVAATLERGTRVEEAVDALDLILRPYGGLGAHGRKEQISHRFLSEEFKQLQMLATVFPAIFLSVAAFLLNVVVGRLMATQRAQIATLKAFGYSSAAVIWHYLQFTILIAFLGTAIGVYAGAQLGAGMAGLYQDVYRFPYLDFSVDPRLVIHAFFISAAAASAGTLYSVLRAARESPAVAMQPEAPGQYRPSIFETPWLSQPTRMIFRNIERRPVKSLLSIAGVAMSTAILVLGGFWGDAVDYMVFAQLRRAQTEDLAVAFFAPLSSDALNSLRGLPGVHYVEPSRTVAARFRVEHRSYRTGLQGMEDLGHLRRLFDREMQTITLPPEGILLTDHLAEMLHVRPGQLLTIELLEGSRATREIPVTGLVREFIGVSAYMRRDALNRFLRESEVITGAYLAVDPQQLEEVNRRLKQVPAVAGVTVRTQALKSFYETLAAQMLTFAFFNTLLAATIAIGVVYNTVRIALSERSRELASLRVLGYTRSEVAYILLGELTVLVFLAIPLGLFAGYQMATFMASTAQTELFRVPVVVEPSTYAFAALVVALATALSAGFVGYKVNHLDLVEVLKARE